MRSITSVAMLLLAAALAGCASAPHESASAAGAALDYPATRTVDVVDDYYGTLVPDLYRWLEDLETEEVRAWAAAQTALTEAHLADVPGRDGLAARIRELDGRFAETERALPDNLTATRQAGREFYRGQLDGEPVLYMRSSPASEPRVVIEPGKVLEDAALRAFFVAPDGRHVAYTLSRGGSNWVTTRIRQVDSDEDLPETLEGMRITSLAWTHDGRGFFYVRSRRPGPGDRWFVRDPGVWYHRLGTPQDVDVPVFTTPPGTTQIYLEVDVSGDGRYAFVYEGTGPTQSSIRSWRTRLHLLDLRDPMRPDLSSRPIPLTGMDAGYNVVHSRGPVLYVTTSHGAPRHRLVAIDVHDPAPERWRDIIPESDGVIEEVFTFGGRLVVRYFENLSTRLRLFSIEGESLGEIALPDVGQVSAVHGRPDHPRFVFIFYSITHPDVVFEHDLDTGISTEIARMSDPFHAGSYELRQLWFTSQDGTRVPMYVAHRRGLTLDGTNPTLMSGYGGSFYALGPDFISGTGAIPWMEAGGVYAIANVRGGGEFGQRWYEAGSLERKQNSIDDFVAAAEQLVATGYTAPHHLAIHGWGHGGSVLIAGSITQRPELFAAAIISNPFLDLLRWEPDWHAAQFGSARDPAQFPFVRAVSPLHRLQPGSCYPATLVATRLDDDRMPAWHALKFVAAMQAAQRCPHPALLHTAADGEVDIWTFAARYTGLRLPAEGTRVR
jgi:prolyl oligopeptidase